MPRLERSGYKRFWPLKQLTGRNPDGSKRSVEGFRNMLTGEFTAPKKGWSGEPLPLPPGERVPETSSKFAQNYDKVVWNKR